MKNPARVHELRLALRASYNAHPLLTMIALRAARKTHRATQARCYAALLTVRTLVKVPGANKPARAEHRADNTSGKRCHHYARRIAA